MKELSIEEKAKAYDKAFERAKQWCNAPNVDKIPTFANRVIKEIFPELSESEDERIRKEIISALKYANVKGVYDKHLAWLEKQGKQTSWKPSKEEMDVLYGLAYITNQYDEHKEEVITRLYQDLKREFFNGSSYENMFPNTEDGVRRRSTIQVLEYARSLDTYNQYGKADIDKNIAWLEKQGEQKVPVADFKAKDWYVSKVDGKIRNIYHSVDKVEPKFRVGDWITNGATKPAQISSIEDDMYYTHNGTIGGDIESMDKDYHLWTIKDAKDGDVLAVNNEVFIYAHRKQMYTIAITHCFVDSQGGFYIDGEFGYVENGKPIVPATKEQHDTLMKAMNDAGYTFDFDKKELRKAIVPIFNIGNTIAKKHNSDINYFGSFTITDITGGKYWYNDRIICDISEQDEWELYESSKQ